MGETEKSNSGILQRLQQQSSSFGTSMNHIEVTQFNTLHFRAPMKPSLSGFSGDCNVNSTSTGGGKRAGFPPSHPNQIPPVSPYSQIPASRQMPQPLGMSQNFGGGQSRPTHGRSLSQPSSFFSLDSLPPLSPSPYRDSPEGSGAGDVMMEDEDAGGNSLLPPSGSLPPRKVHRRSSSDIPFGFSGFMQSSSPMVTGRGLGELERGFGGGESLGMGKSVQRVKKELGWDSNVEGMGEKKTDAEVVDDLISAYMNLDNIDALNSSGTAVREGLDSGASGSKTNACESSDNEAESSINESGISSWKPAVSSSTEKREGMKRSAGSDIAPTSRHYRSVSMDSFMGKLNFGDESPKLPPSSGPHPGKHSPSNSVDGTPSFSLEFANGEFSEAELKKIMANEKLAEIALSDPKRAKRILANRQSAARSKERKMRYISELEHKVQTLQTEATTLSAQLTLLQRDSVALTNQNNELKFRLQAMEQQAHLKDALNEALTAEVQRLKLATSELSGESAQSMISQSSVNSQMFQMQQQRPIQHQQPQSHTQPQQSSQHQNGGSNTEMDSK